MMNEEFVPYQEALDLKELGFNEPCLTWFIMHKSNNIIELVRPYWDREFGYTYNSGLSIDCVLAPLYQQAFKFFREKYELYHIIHCPTKDVAAYTITGFDIPSVHSNTELKTYEEAELACLKKLIDVVKNKQHE